MEKRVHFVALGDLRVNLEAIAAVKFEAKDLAKLLLMGANFADEFGPIKIADPKHVETLRRAVDAFTIKY